MLKAPPPPDAVTYRSYFPASPCRVNEPSAADRPAYSESQSSPWIVRQTRLSATFATGDAPLSTRPVIVTEYGAGVKFWVTVLLATTSPGIVCANCCEGSATAVYVPGAAGSA